jgi:hypothetical protein
MGASEVLPFNTLVAEQCICTPEYGPWTMDYLALCVALETTGMLLCDILVTHELLQVKPPASSPSSRTRQQSNSPS